MNIPTRPVHTLPLSRTITASSRVSAATPTTWRAPERLVLAPDVDVEERQRIEPHDQQSRHRDGSEYRVHRGSAVLGPVDVLEMQDQCELVEDERRADPEEDCGNGEFGYPTVDGKSHHRDARHHDQDDADDDVMDVQCCRGRCCVAATTSAGCRFRGGLRCAGCTGRSCASRGTSARNAIRHHINGSRPGGIARSRSKSSFQSSSTVETYADLQHAIARMVPDSP